MILTIDYQLITFSIIDIAQEAATFIREQSGKFKRSDIIEKGLHDMVSYVDKQSEEMIIKGLKNILPQAGFIAEESGNAIAEKFNWIIDPLDGTTNFVHGIPLFSISIALKEENSIVSAVVLEVNSRECFYAWKDGPAYCNGLEINVSTTQKISQSLIATGFPYSDFSRMISYMQVFDKLMRESRGIRRLGSAALDLAYVACGRFEVFYEYGLHPWDVAAGVLIVERAGGKLSGFNGSDEVIFGKDILASNGNVHEEMLAITKECFENMEETD
ncbi:MAG: myo-inositol-1(or 4)-monophosphatase [Bacteroidetes bacterium]|nr:MAG: myo-inositol-1(or 4)-monophosphatase [Bacteroidota bacterium]